MYRIYIRTAQQQIIPYSKTDTNDRAVALFAFDRLINNPDFQGKKLAVSMTFNGKNLAFHKFNCPNTSNDWRGRLDEIEEVENGQPTT